VFSFPVDLPSSFDNRKDAKARKKSQRLPASPLFHWGEPQYKKDPLFNPATFQLGVVFLTNYEPRSNFDHRDSSGVHLTQPTSIGVNQQTGG
jgi:hypothetical protein